MATNYHRTASEKIRIFRDLFSGMPNVYGTYDPNCGRSRQVKKPVTDRVLKAHLTGRRPYGIYLLVKDRTRAIAVDFDSKDRLPPFEFISAAKHYGLKAYIERSKSKGYHVWIFFKSEGVLAYKARLVVSHVLEEIEQPSTEVFPKQDVLDVGLRYGNFINAPLFGRLVLQGKTAFVEPATFKAYQDQWSFLESIKKADETILDEIIEMNGLPAFQSKTNRSWPKVSKAGNGFGLPPCARKMLEEGVTQFQRVSCFRLAVNLNKIGIPYEMAELILKRWATKNKPVENKRIITEKEITDQTAYAFKKNYRGYGCDSKAVRQYCEHSCPVNKLHRHSSRSI